MNMYGDKPQNANGTVVCRVNTCEYYNNDYCTASKIEVEKTESKCDCSEDTMCRTYKSSSSCM